MKSDASKKKVEQQIKIGLIKKIFSKMEILLKCFSFSTAISWESSKTYFTIRIVSEIIVSLLPFVALFLGKELLNQLVKYAGSMSNINIVLVGQTLLLLLIISSIGRIVDKIKQTIGGIHGDIIANYINIQISQKASSLDMAFFDSPKFYDGIINVRRDSGAIQTLTWLSIDVIRASLQLIIASLILMNLQWTFVIIILLLGIPSMITQRKFSEYVYVWGKSKAPEERKMNYLISLITGGGGVAKDIRLYNLFEPLMERYTNIWKEWFSQKRKITLKKGLKVTLTSIIPDIGVVAIKLFIGVKIIYGKLTLGDYTLYSGLVEQIETSIFILVSAVSNIYDNNLRILNYLDFLSWKPNLIQQGNLKPPLQPSIEFINVCFRYPGKEEYTLYKLSFKIFSKEKVALVGLNGAGKSTIIKLILRFYDPTEGRILVDGIDIHKYDTDKYRGIFGVLLQDYANYAFNVRDSISMSDLSHSEDNDRILNACHMSGVDSVIAKWEKGLDTFLTRGFEKDGVELSGGEWQRIALARVFFRNGGIIILDEPSASLDAEAEHKIFEHFTEVCREKGAIFISHRLANVTTVDKIFVIEEGQLIESGSHGELIEKCGRYAYMFNLQAEKYKTA